jgi:DNA topoisomerase-3
MSSLVLRLYIAEKPSLGRAIASALPKPHKNQTGYIEVGNGDVVSWCIGHILEQAQPEAYDETFKKWQMQHLPIIPEQWQLKPKAQTRSQLTVLRKLIKSAGELIHAGDPDREGQLLVDEVIDYLKVPNRIKKNTKRLLISDLNLPAVKRALNSLRDNSDFMPLSISALARSRADWLYGINLTRAYTLQGQKAGFHGVLSVGRVQTPLLGLVVRRDQEIEQFIAKPYFDVHAHITTQKGERFIAKWQPSAACTPYMDESKRVVVKSLAENVVSRIYIQTAIINSIDKEEKKQSAPLPYSLSSLQIDAAKQFSMNAKLVLDVCQALYEKHKLVTYPRSDCRYLPIEHHQQAASIINLLAQSTASYQTFAINADAKIRSRAWNNSKVSAHHAIIPTEKSAAKVNLNPFEKNIYFLIVRQYLAQFYPVHIYEQTKISLTIAGGIFSANAKSPTQQGWKSLFKKQNGKQSSDSRLLLEQQSLPCLTKEDKLHCDKGELLEKMTQAPSAFTDATLLAAMTGIARYVQDKNIKKILKETDGLGTEATRAGIIDLLFKRGFLQRNGKSINATDIGTSLINTLPTSATYPDMTAQWEAILNEISEKKTSYQHFMTPLNHTLIAMVNQAEQQPFTGLPKVPFKPKFKRKTKRATKAKKT